MATAFSQTMKTSALRFLGFSLISIFCGTAAAYDADAKLEKMKALQAAMEQAQQDKNLHEAIRLAKEIKAIAAEMQPKRAEREKAEEAAPEPTPEIKPVVAAQPTPVESAEPAEADQGSPYAKDVERLVKQRDSESAQAIAPIQKRFDLATQQLLRKATQAGNLDAANKIKAAIDNPPDLATLREESQTPMEKELLRLAEQREKDSATAVAPAQKRFDLAAQQLIRKATQAGNLEAANELKAMIDEVSGSAEDTKSASIKSTDPSSKSSFKIKESPEKDFEFRFDGESVVITKYIGNSENVGVPEKIQGKQVVGIGNKAFSDNYNIKEIVLPGTLEFIGWVAFSGCKNLSKVNMPPSLKKIVSGAFIGTAIKKLSIPANVISFGPTGFNTNLESIEVDPENKSYVSIDGVVYDKNIKTLINVPCELKMKSLKLPDSVEKVIAFSVAGIRSASKLKEIHIPKNAIIEENAFAGSENIEVVRY